MCEMLFIAIKEHDEIESDGPHSPTNSITANSPKTRGIQEYSSGSQRGNNVTAERAGRRQRPEKPTAEDDGAEIRAGRRQCPAKPTAHPSEFYYF